MKFQVISKKSEAFKPPTYVNIYFAYFGGSRTESLSHFNLAIAF